MLEFIPLEVSVAANVIGELGYFIPSDVVVTHMTSGVLGFVGGGSWFVTVWIVWLIDICIIFYIYIYGKVKIWYIICVLYSKVKMWDIICARETHEQMFLWKCRTYGNSKWDDTHTHKTHTHIYICIYVCVYWANDIFMYKGCWNKSLVRFSAQTLQWKIYKKKIPPEKFFTVTQITKEDWCYICDRK